MITEIELAQWLDSRTLTDPAQKIARYDALLDTLVWERTVRKMLETSPEAPPAGPEIGLPDAPFDVPEMFR